jgi:hypothetical protein
MRTILLFIVGALLAGCSPSLDRPVIFRVAADFRGPFILLEDESFSGDFSKEASGYFLDIPSDGVARVRSSRVLQKYHKAFVEFPDGSRLEQTESGGDPNQRVCFAGGTYWMLSGPQWEASFVSFTVGPPCGIGEAEMKTWLRQRKIIP